MVNNSEQLAPTTSSSEVFTLSLLPSHKIYHFNICRHNSNIKEREGPDTRAEVGCIDCSQQRKAFCPLL
ncbi:hypothetical protein MKX03_029045 [Papaver bracteatum]|nr:hypothetical protein MKX03_029045 [Papaver bracteatum]